MTDLPLSPELQSNVADHEWAKQEIRGVTDGLSDTQFNWRPQDDAWSVAECIDHLLAVGEAMVPLLQSAISEARAQGSTADGPFSYGFFGNKFVQMAGEQKNPAKGKVKAPKLYVPGSKHEKEPLAARFIRLQDDLIVCNRDAMGIDLKRVKITSPAIRIVRLSLGQWLIMLPNHQKRHFQQAQRVLEKMPDSM
jgi:DinB superfamily